MADATTRWRVMLAAPALLLFAAACGSSSWPGSVASTRTGETEFPSERPGGSDESSQSGPLLGGTVPVTASGYVLGVMVLDDRRFYPAIQQVGGARVYMIYQNDGTTNGEFDEAKFRRTIARRVPPDWESLAMLDFEGHWLSDLEALPNTDRFREGEARMLKLIRIARELRPKAKWSFYGLPTLPYWIKNEKGRGSGWDTGSDDSKRAAIKRALRAQRVVAACDWVSPTIYDPYLDENTPPDGPRHKASVEARVRLAKEMGGGRPVMPTIWHRVHESNKKDGLALLSTDEWFEQQAIAALDAGASGVVWWGADRYFARTGKLRDRRPQEVQGISGNNSDQMKDYLLRLHLDRLRALNDALSAYAARKKSLK